MRRGDSCDVQSPESMSPKEVERSTFGNSQQNQDKLFDDYSKKIDKQSLNVAK